MDGRTDTQVVDMTQRVDMTTAPKDYRKELWIGIAIAVARAENCRSSTVPADWADAALRAFDRTFGRL